MPRLNPLCACLSAGMAITFTTSLAQAGDFAGPPYFYANGMDIPGVEAFRVRLLTPSMTAAPFTLTDGILGHIFEPGVTDPAGPSPTIYAEIGLGPFGSNPQFDDSGWTWFGAAWISQSGTGDLYVGAIPAPSTPGLYSFTYRFGFLSPGGLAFTLADLNGAGLGFGSQSFDPQLMGVLIVTPTPGAAALLGLGGLVMTRRRR